MRVMLLGSPGVGKGTQAQFICEQYHIPQISTGNILRAAMQSGSELGLMAKSYSDQGNLVPDEVVCSIVKERLAEPDCVNGFLLDGFPRTIPQAEALVKLGIALDFVVVLDAPVEEIVARLTGRRFHAASGRTYHIEFQPPKVAEKDDITGEPLTQRDDDKEDVVRNRLSVYERQTAPLINFYEEQAKIGAVKIAFVSGLGDIEDVKANIFKILSK
ncbi:MAG: adenylate kinase [Pseudomonadota bacterium]